MRHAMVRPCGVDLLIHHPLTVRVATLQKINVYYAFRHSLTGPSAHYQCRYAGKNNFVMRHAMVQPHSVVVL